VPRLCGLTGGNTPPRGAGGALFGVLLLCLVFSASVFAHGFPLGASTQFRSPENCFSSAPAFGCGSRARGVDIGTG
jgi:hypothetical protein